MQDVIPVFNSEHARIWRMLNTLEQVHALPERADPAFYRAAFDYLEALNTLVHHPREQRYFFPTVRSRCPDVAPLLDTLEAEHVAQPKALARLREFLAGTGDPHPRFDPALRELIHVEREHIKREDRILIARARESFLAADWRAIHDAFERDPAFSESVQDSLRERYRAVTNFAPEPIGLGLRQGTVEGTHRVLEIEDLSCHYGRIQALRAVTLSVREGELVALVGANGAGKTTLLRAISGVQPASGGVIRYRGRDITGLPPDERVRLGIAQVPEGRQVFAPMSVEDNLRLGAYTRPRVEAAETLERMYGMFPILAEKRRQAAGVLSGGQQQMLVIARALMAHPRLLLLDEPSMGLAPLLVDEIFDAVGALRAQGITIFLVEQNAYAALSAVDHAHVLETGRVVLSGEGGELLDNEKVRTAYLGM